MFRCEKCGKEMTTEGLGQVIRDLVREAQRREEEEEGRGVEGVVCGGAGVIM